MTDRYLYTCPLPRDAQTDTGGRARQQLAEHGLLDSDSGAVDAISTDPGEHDLTLTYVGPYASKLAAEVDELATNSGMEPIPFFAAEASTPADGYYAVKAADVGREVPQTDAFAAVDVTLTREGTREGLRRSVTTTPRQVENDFGNQQTALLGVPSAARDVQWLDESEQTEPVEIVETHAGEYGDVDVVDARASSFTNPTLVFDLPYREEWKTAVHVFDTQDGSKTDDSGILRWMRVFRESHDFAGAPVVSNRLVRLTFGDDLTVETWDDSAGAWTTVGLGDSAWVLDAWDLTRISPERVDAQCRFRDPGQSPAEVYHLNVSVKRGWRWPQWTVPKSLRASDTPEPPTGLRALLEPVADGADYSPQADQGVVDLKEVRA